MSFPWEAAYSIGAVILLAAIVWGVVQNSKRNRANDAVTEAATRASYKDPEGYQQGKKEEFDKQVRPS